MIDDILVLTDKGTLQNKISQNNTKQTKHDIRAK